MHPTEDVNITVGSGKTARRFMLPAHDARDIEAFIKARIRALDSQKLIPAKDVLPELADAIQRPAMVLRGARHRAGLTQAQLAKKLNIRQHHVSEMESGKRPIGKDMAKRLADALQGDYRVFL